MNFIIDILLVAIFALCFISGWRKGFIKTVMKLITFLAAGIGAYILYPYPSDYMYGNIFMPKISSLIEDSILSGGAGQSLAELFSTKPDFFVDTVNRYSTLPKVEGYYNADKTVTVSGLSEFMADPLARTLSNVLGFILIFILILIGLKIVTYLADKLCKLPVLHGTNTLLGIICGAALGFVTVWLAASVIAGFIPSLHSAFPEIFEKDLFEQTYVLKWLYNFNPLKFI